MTKENIYNIGSTNQKQRSSKAYQKNTHSNRNFSKPFNKGERFDKNKIIKK